MTNPAGPAAAGAAPGPAVAPGGSGADRPPRLAILSYSSGEFDARTARVARSAIAAGYSVVVYARLQDGLPAVEERDGYRVVRASWSWWLLVPGFRRLGLRRQGHTRTPGAAATGRGHDADNATASAGSVQPASGRPRAGAGGTLIAGAAPVTLKARVLRASGRLGDAVRAVLMFPCRPLAWARGLDEVVAPADVWHGMWAGSLPALERQSGRLGGRTVYDSRDVYMHSRLFATTYRPLRAVLGRIERRWAQRVDRVLTVNEACATLIVGQLGVPRPTVVMNCPDRWTPPDPPPDRIRAALQLGPETAIAIYQGQLLSDRGIEQAMDAILDVPGAVLVLLGFGPLRAGLEARAGRPPWSGRVFVLPAVAPDELLSWTASADVSVMPIRATSMNHLHATPQKLFESLAVGVPVVAADLPSMAEIVRAVDAGVLVDPESPASIAAGIRSVLEATPAERAARRARVMEVVHERYTWEAQVPALLEVYRELLAMPARPGRS